MVWSNKKKVSKWSVCLFLTQPCVEEPSVVRLKPILWDQTVQNSYIRYFNIAGVYCTQNSNWQHTYLWLLTILKYEKKAEGEQSESVSHGNVSLSDWHWCDWGKSCWVCFCWRKKKQEVCRLRHHFTHRHYVSQSVCEKNEATSTLS